MGAATLRGAQKAGVSVPETATAYLDLPHGRMRSRSAGKPSAGVPEVVLVMGMAVADYLLPGIGALSGWTRAHLVELPGYGGSGDPPRELSVAENGAALRAWVEAAELEEFVLAGHSSGTQVAAHAAAPAPAGLRALVLASPTIDPVARSLPRLFLRWRLDGRWEPPGLGESHRPEWRRAGVRRLAHLVRSHLDDRLEDVLPRVAVPVLVLRGREDRLLTHGWAAELAREAYEGRLVEVPGAHTFPWASPDAWCEPIRELALAAVSRRGPSGPSRGRDARRAGSRR